MTFYAYAVVITRDNGTVFLALGPNGDGCAIFKLRKDAWEYARALRAAKMDAKTIRITLTEGWL